MEAYWDDEHDQIADIADRSADFMVVLGMRILKRKKRYAGNSIPDRELPRRCLSRPETVNLFK